MKQTMPWPGSVLHDAALGHAEEAHVQVVQALPLRLGSVLRRPVGRTRSALLLHVGDTGEAVVRRVPQHHQDRPLALHLVRSVALFFEFDEGQMLGISRRLPSGQRVGQEHAHPLLARAG